MNISKKTWIIVIAIALVVAGGVFFYVSTNNETSGDATQQTETEQMAPSTAIVFSEDGTVVSHDGVEGEVALTTLKSLADVRTEGSTYGEFVVGIGEVDASSNVNFWGFYVNGEMATVGSGDYVAEEGDQIEWQLTELN